MASFSLKDRIPYSSHISPEIIKLKGGSYMMCFRLGGVHYVGKSRSEIDSRIVQIGKFVSGLKAPYRYNLYLQSHCLRSGASAALPADFMPGSFAESLNREYEERVIYSRPIISTDYYLSIIYRPYRRILGKSLIKTTRQTIAEFARQAEDTLGKVRDAVLSYFADYDIQPLSCYENDKGVLFSEPLHFLNRIVNLGNNPVPVQRGPIEEYLPTATLTLGNNELIRIDNEGRTRYGVFLTFAEFPSATSTGMLQEFLELPWEMIITQNYVPIDKTEVKGWLDREYNRMLSGDDASETDLQDMQEAKEGVQSDAFVLGEFYWQALLIDDDPQVLRKKIGQATAILSNCGFTTSVNKIARLHSYFAQFPGNIALQPRKAKLSSFNTAQMMPYQVQNRGKQFGNMWGSAVAMLRTVNEEVFYFNFHDPEKGVDAKGEDVAGNTIIAGTIGSGKTVLMSFLLAQTQRYKTKPRIVVFDKDLGTSVFIKAMGGKYSEIELGKPTGFNPFHLENTPQNQAFLNELILAILEGDGGKVSATEKRQIDEAIKQTLNSPRDIARFDAFTNYLPDGDNSVRQRLHDFAYGKYTWVFNNDEDNFSLDAGIIGIDYTQFLGIPAICTPILMYLFHRIQMLLDGTPTLIALDEAWTPLSYQQFSSYLENKLRTIRKEKGVLVFATQSPGDFYRGVSEVFMQQIATQILLPNPNATEEVYIGKVGLQPEEFALIKDMGKYSREFLVRYQGETAHCKLDMRGIDTVKILSGSKSRAILAEKLMREHGSDWMPAYYAALTKTITDDAA